MNKQLDSLTAICFILAILSSATLISEARWVSLLLAIVSITGATNCLLRKDATRISRTIGWLVWISFIVLTIIRLDL